MPEPRALAEIFRDEYGKVLAYTLRVASGDFDAAEEAVQEAFARAAEDWPRRGTPRSPAAWLARVAGRVLVDAHRRRGTRERRSPELALLAEERESEEASAIPDHRLGLLFACCHPALDPDVRSGLILRVVAGLGVAEIARAFLTTEAAMARRLGRAKAKLRGAGIPFEVPEADALDERLGGVLRAIYLIFNEGYSATAGAELVRRDLCDEAIRLGRVLGELLPDSPEAQGLLALMLLHDSRRASRVDGDGALVALDEQDRERWDRARIAEGLAALRAATGRSRPGPYQVQAAIAAAHAEAPSAARTDWAAIVKLYTMLEGLEPSPVVTLNRIAAEAMLEGPAAGLERLEALVGSGLERYRPLAAARADLLRRAGRPDAARTAYREALALAPNGAEAAYFRRRIEELSE